MVYGGHDGGVIRCVYGMWCRDGVCVTIFL